MKKEYKVAIRELERMIKNQSLSGVEIKTIMVAIQALSSCSRMPFIWNYCPSCGQKLGASWVKITTRPMTEEEKKHCEADGIAESVVLTCDLPEDGQEVLVSYWGTIGIATFRRDPDYGCGFDEVDIEDADAWMPLPEPYMESEG